MKYDVCEMLEQGFRLSLKLRSNDMGIFRNNLVASSFRELVLNKGVCVSRN